MPEIKFTKNVFKVVLTEHERGWGQKPFDVKYFDNETEAKQYALDYNCKNNNLASAPDWYVVASYEGKVA